MVCKVCGKDISNEGISFCPHCGSYLRDIKINVTVNNINKTLTYEPAITFNNDKKKKLEEEKKLNKKNKKNKNKKDILVYLVVLLLWVVALYMLLQATEDNYYFNNDNNNVVEVPSDNPSEPSSPSDPGSSTPSEPTTPSTQINPSNVTAIKYNNKYLKQYYINSINDVYSLIQTDSNSQKINCPGSIIKYENMLINNYGLQAANLCEMDNNFAIELVNVFNYVYNNYPSARGYLTNITLANVDNGSYMAAFIPIFTFVTNNSSSGYPMGIKSMVVLNAKYFLDVAKISNSVKYGVSSGYFPANATKSSTVAHEMGHYISFVALLNYYKMDQVTFVRAQDSNLLFDVYDDFNSGNFSYKVINTAYNTYRLTYSNDLTFDQFRNSISEYAMAKDNNGNYIYDETIAEAFHDCYLNGDNAKIASKLIINTLKGYL